MKSTEWQLKVKVDKLDEQGIKDFTWQINGGHGLGVPIEGFINKIRTDNNGSRHAEMIELKGSWRGAWAILDEFLPRLSPENGKVRICFNKIADSDYQSLLPYLSELDSPPRVQFTPPSLKIIFKNEQIGDYSSFASLFCKFIPQR